MLWNCGYRIYRISYYRACKVIISDGLQRQNENTLHTLFDLSGFDLIDFVMDTKNWLRGISRTSERS